MTDKQQLDRAKQAQAQVGSTTKSDEYTNRPDGRFLETCELRYLIQQQKRTDLTSDEAREAELMFGSIICDAEHVPAGLTRTEAAELHSLNQRTGFSEACSDIFTFCKPHMS